METIKKDNQPFQCTIGDEKACHLIDKKITKHQNYGIAYFNKLFQVKCDASGMAVGVVLSQDDKPVAYFSDKLNDAKQKYPSYDKEFYAIVQTLKKWRNYWATRKGARLSFATPGMQRKVL